MHLEQLIPALYGKKHGYIRRLDMKSFEHRLAELEILDRYHRVEFHGLENIPASGGALLVGNHGPFGMDALFVIKHVYEGRGRVVRALADRAVFQIPFYRLYATALGVVEGEPDQAVELLQGGSLVSVYPGGLREAVKSPRQKYQVRPFWQKALGFVRVALRAQVPIIPIACVGIDDVVFQARTAEQMHDSFFMRQWQKKMNHEKYTAPLWVGLGPLPLPLPVKLTYHVGWPIHLGYGPEAADNEAVLRSLQDRVAGELEEMLRYGLAQRQRSRERFLKALGIGGQRLLRQAQRLGEQVREAARSAA